MAGKLDSVVFVCPNCHTKRTIETMGWVLWVNCLRCGTQMRYTGPSPAGEETPTTSEKKH